MQARLKIKDSDSEGSIALEHQAIELFNKHGALWLENLYNPQLIRNIYESFVKDYATQSSNDLQRKCLKLGEGRYMMTLRLVAPFNDPALLANPFIERMADLLLGERHIIQSIGAACAFPHANMQRCHRDHPALFPELGRLNNLFPSFAFSLVVPLVDLNAETGTTAVWAGSHRENKNRTEYELEHASFPWACRGDAYLMDSRLVHQGLSNNSNVIRPLIYIVYAREWFTDRVNYSKQLPLWLEDDDFDRLDQSLKVRLRLPVNPSD